MVEMKVPQSKVKEGEGADPLSLPISRGFHQASKDPFLGHVPIPPDYDKWPEEWKTTYYKVYPRYDKITLPSVRPCADLGSTIAARKSQRDFTSAPLSIEEYGQLLQYSSGIMPDRPHSPGDRSHRAVASAGMRFPVETYVFVCVGNTEVPAGVYHYNVKDHTLERLLHSSFTAADIEQFGRAEWLTEVSAMVVYTGIFWRTQVKYGERGYRYVLMEAGQISQNLALMATSLDIQHCAFGGTNDHFIEQQLDIDGSTESFLAAVAIGK